MTIIFKVSAMFLSAFYYAENFSAESEYQTVVMFKRAAGVSGCRRCLVASAALHSFSYYCFHLFLLWLSITYLKEWCLVCCSGILLHIFAKLYIWRAISPIFCLRHSRQIYYCILCAVFRKCSSYSVYSHLART